MKTNNLIVKTAGVIAAFMLINVLTVLSGFANMGGDIKFLLKGNKSEKSAVFMLGDIATDAKVYMRIVDENGRQLYSASLRNKESVARKFDFSKMPAGKYNLYVQVKDNKVTQKINENFEISETGVVFGSGEAMSAVVNPLICKLEERTLKVFLEGNEKTTPITVSLNDAQGGLVYRHTFKGADLVKKFDLSYLKSGAYRLTVEKGMTTYHEKVNLK